MLCFTCKTDKKDAVETLQKNKITDTVFNKDQWQTKDGKDYPFRENMVRDVIYNDTIRTLTKDQLLNLLGEPDYIRDQHLYYRIEESRLGNWTFKTKTMVVKIEADTSIVWIKMHE